MMGQKNNIKICVCLALQYMKVAGFIIKRFCVCVCNFLTEHGKHDLYVCFGRLGQQRYAGLLRRHCPRQWKLLSSQKMFTSYWVSPTYCCVKVRILRNLKSQNLPLLSGPESCMLSYQEIQIGANIQISQRNGNIY